MTNKNVLQIIAGFLSLISFFSGWVVTRNFVVIFSPTDFLSNPNDYVPLKFLFLGLPIIGLYNIYCGYIKKTNALATIGNAVLCGYLLIAVYGGVASSDILNSVTTGYYMCLFSFVVSAVTIITRRKEIKNAQKNHTV